MKTRTTILTLALITSLTCFGWGQKGHDVVAYIAECHLTPNAKAAVEAALDGKSIVYYANWLDNASHQPEYAYSKTWHYKNIDADKTYETMSLNHRGDVVTALNEQIAKLQAGGLSHTDEALALKMVVHLVGDVHQPMHLGHLSDLGGNRWSVTYFGRERNLHGIWDTDLVESAHKWSYTEWQQQIDSMPTEESAKELDKTPDDWARETYNLATWVYASTPEGTKISYDYVATAAVVIEQQLLFGGLRLAETLNSIYDK